MHPSVLSDMSVTFPAANVAFVKASGIRILELFQIELLVTLGHHGSLTLFIL